VTATVHRLPVKRLLPLSAQMRDATVTAYQRGQIDRATALNQLDKIGMDPVSAAREIADAVQF